MSNQERIDEFKRKYGRYPNLMFINPEDRDLFPSFEGLEIREYKFIERGKAVLTIKELTDL